MAVNKAFAIAFTAQGTTPQAVRASADADPAQVCRALRLPSGGRAIAVMGGAALMEGDSARTIRSGLEDGLARFAQEHQVTVVDGGTAAGVMELLGVARARRRYTFPLVGVTVAGRVAYPGHAVTGEHTLLDAYHSHFALVEGEHFGDESNLLAGIALTVASNGGKALGVIINGGAIVKREAHARATGPLRMPLLVLTDSGRFADELAGARASGSSDPVLNDILAQGEVYFLSAHSGAKGLRSWLEQFFGVAPVEGVS
jgi:hypothetical protein